MAQTTASYGQTLAKSLTIEEMRTLHRHALSEAEAKKTELKLVLASRYRELVGSSDEVLDMQRDAKLLDECVSTLPSLMQDVLDVAVTVTGTGTRAVSEPMSQPEQQQPEQGKEEEENDSRDSNTIDFDRLYFAMSPRIIHACLDETNVYGAAVSLIETFQLMTKYTRQYPLANALATVSSSPFNRNKDSISSLSKKPNAALEVQMKMIYLHLQSLPLRTIQMAKNILLIPSQQVKECRIVAQALSAIHLLHVHGDLEDNNDNNITSQQRGNALMDLYFESKAKLIHELLDALSSTSTQYHHETSHPSSFGNSANAANASNSAVNVAAAASSSDGGVKYSLEATDVAEQIISKIVLILQYDIILFPYQIFQLRTFHTETNVQQKEMEHVMSSLPSFDEIQLKTKISNFLASHLPLIRSKVKTILVAIAGTTASRLGHFRQSLYDKTDGAECLASLSSQVCSWEDAIQCIDVKIVTRALEGVTTSASVTSSTPSLATWTTRKFSLWSTLFSNTFSSLVHSILSTSFHSVHRKVVSTVRASLANAPPFRDILPHEAYRNTLRIATELDDSLKKVSDDAHELLVHSEERDESVRRLKQSLYVQTCEIMGRLLNELRRMLSNKSSQEDEEDATKELLVGRLCYLLKFRITTLPFLLDPNSSPAIIATKSGGKVGMISLTELQSAFEISDVDGDGLISLDEAMEAMEAAFSGTHFRGAEMVRETMLISSDGNLDSKSSAHRTLTISELTLLSARGLRHASKGPESALGTIQRILDDIVKSCFTKWSKIILMPASTSHRSQLNQFVEVSSSVSSNEWKRLYLPELSSLGEVIEQDIGSALDKLSVADQDSSFQGRSLIGSVSSFHIAYIVSTAVALNKSICPADSLQPFPSTDYASSMGIETDGNAFDLANIMRSCLVRESLQCIVQSFNFSIVEMDDNLVENDESKIEKCVSPSLLQLHMDLEFILKCYKTVTTSSNYLSDEDNDCQALDILRGISSKITNALDSDSDIDLRKCQSSIQSRHQNVFESCSMFLTVLFGEDNLSSEDDMDTFSATSDNGNVPLLMNPLSSSRRFALLPIQTGQSVKELELLNNLENERTEKTDIDKISSSASAAASAVTSSFGYFSSLLKKK